MRSLYLQLVEKARENDDSLVIVVHVTDQLIQRLPWELTWDETANDYIAFRWPIIRSFPSTTIAAGPVVESPIRVLAIAANPTDLDQLDIAAEQSKLERAVAPLKAAGRIELRWLPGNRWEDLNDALRSQERWHVVHFVGHGGHDDERDEGYIALVRKDATTSDPVSATEPASAAREAEQTAPGGAQRVQHRPRGRRRLLLGHRGHSRAPRRDRGRRHAVPGERWRSVRVHRGVVLGDRQAQAHRRGGH